MGQNIRPLEQTLGRSSGQTFCLQLLERTPSRTWTISGVWKRRFLEEEGIVRVLLLRFEVGKTMWSSVEEETPSWKFIEDLWNC